MIQVGADPASSVYVRNKKNACAYIGIGSESYELPEETSEEELLALIAELNHKEEVCGILVQLPLPAHINEEKVILAIDPPRMSMVSSAECRGTDDRKQRIFAVYTGRRDSAVEKIRY